MKFFLLVLSIFIMFDVSAKSGDAFKIKIGHATLEGVMPGKRTKRAPDLAIDEEFDICGWLEDENNQNHNAQKELLRKLWEFKRIFKAPHGSLVFSVSIANNKRYRGDFESYYNWITKKKKEQLQEFEAKGYTDHNYSPVVGFEEINLSNHQWIKFSSDNNSSKYFWTMLDENIILRLNLIQSDDRNKAVKGEWHPNAEKFANEIIESIKLFLPTDGNLCNCSKSKY